MNGQIGMMRTFAGPLLVALFALAAVFWTLNSKHFFYADDWGWLERAAFGHWQELVRPIPLSIYNDRPAGEVFIRILYNFFGLNSHPFNVFMLALHALNCILLYFIALNVLTYERALVASILAACWFSTLTAVHWVGAMFDLVGATWCLLCLLFYASASRRERGMWRALAGAIAMHILAIRTKEFALAMIVVLAGWEFFIVKEQQWRRRLIRLAPHAAVTLLYVAVYLILYSKSRSFVDGGTYQLSFAPASLIRNIGYYFSEAFYATFSKNMEVNLVYGYILCALTIIIACMSRVGLFGLVSAAGLMTAVLLMPNQRNVLYLYVPHFFLAMTLCSALQGKSIFTLSIVLAVAALIAWPIYIHEWKFRRDFALINGAYSKNLFDDYVSQFRARPPADTMTMGVVRTYFDPFSWGRGSALRIYYLNPIIRANVFSLPKSGVDVCSGVQGVCIVEKDGHLVVQ